MFDDNGDHDAKDDGIEQEDGKDWAQKGSKEHPRFTNKAAENKRGKGCWYFGEGNLGGLAIQLFENLQVYFIVKGFILESDHEVSINCKWNHYW